jgi:hypothetical protein
MLPHDDALHETLHVTPLAEESLFTVAVKWACAPAGTEVESPDTAIVIGALGELLPPQPTMIIIEANATSVRAMDPLAFTCASEIPEKPNVQQSERIERGPASHFAFKNLSAQSRPGSALGGRWKNLEPSRLYEHANFAPHRRTCQAECGVAAKRSTDGAATGVVAPYSRGRVVHNASRSNRFHIVLT